MLALGPTSAMPSEVAKEAREREVEGIYRDLTARVDSRRIAGTYAAIAAFGSRLAGSDGESATFDYVERAFRRLGLTNIRREPFEVSIPDPEARGSLALGGRSVELLPLWPNLVRTSTCDVEGILVYGGDGSMEALDGKPVQGAIVLLEWNSGGRWRNAAKLGAQAVVFLAPRDGSRAEAEQKFVSVPVRMPRFYLPIRDAGPVLAGAFNGSRARLTCRQDWVSRRSFNLLADLPGTDPRLERERVLISTHADAMSVVPGMAPGAEGIGGISALLEAARIYRDRPGRRPIRFMLSGAHGLGLQGAREYVDRRLESDREPLFLALSLDLASGSGGLGAFGRSFYYEYRNESQVPLQMAAGALRRHADRLARVLDVSPTRRLFVDAVNQSDQRTWRNNIPGPFAFDCEPFVNAGYPALTLATTEDGRERVDTPFDTVDRVLVPNVVRQTRTVVVMLHHVLADDSSRQSGDDHRLPIQTSRPKRISLIGGFSTIEGQVAVYDPQRSFVPDTPVPGALAVRFGLRNTTMGVRGAMVQLVRGEEARYRFVGVPPYISYPRDLAPPNAVAAFRLDPASGEIDYAPDSGALGSEDYPTIYPLKTGYKASPIVVFPCVTIDLYDLVDPQELKALPSLRVLDAKTGSAPMSFGIAYGVQGKNVRETVDLAALFLRPGQRFQLLTGDSAEQRLVLVNASPGDEQGIGFVAPGGDGGEWIGREAATLSGLFPNVALESARDLILLNAARLDRFAKYRIISDGVIGLQGQAFEALEQADLAVAEQRWSDAERYSRAAWGYALRAHPVIQSAANDVVAGVIFYLFLIVPFSYFVERLAFGCRTLTGQLGWASLIFVLSFLLLRLVHPAFEIVTNPSMIFVAFVMGVLSLVVIAFILGKFEVSLKSLRQARGGVHEVDIGRVSVALAAFNLGVGNMRRRKARTFLTVLTLVVMTFIVLSFTSIVSDVQLTELASGTRARYPGLMLRSPGLDPMQPLTHRQMENEFEGRGEVARRVYYYGADVADTGILTLSRADRLADARALLGLDPSESEVSRPQEALLEGGRWFLPGERYVMILPQDLADTLKVDRSEVGRARVTFAGTEYTVVGILDPSILRSIVDLDGDGLLPPDFSLSTRYQQETGSSNQAFRSFLRLEPGVCVIVPAETAMGLGGDLRSIAVAFDRPEETREALEELMPRLRMNLYAAVPAGDSDELQVRQFSVFHKSKGSGMGLVLVQLLIAGIFVLNTMVASVFERTKEISILSSIGLAPNHISMLFFAESLVYGVVGAVAGYFTAQGLARVIVATGAFPGLQLNFSSTSAVISAATVMGVVLLSTLYPARQASRIAAPAHSEEAFESEPDGDEWSLPLPFSVGESEAAPLVMFLGEWLQSYEEYAIGDFVTSGTEVRQAVEGGGMTSSAVATAWLAPFDLGVSQYLEIRAFPSPAPEIYQLELRLRRLGGEPDNWVTVNRRFLDSLRRQFLTWRTLEPEQRAAYADRAPA
jgi:cell division protein FtsX